MNRKTLWIATTSLLVGGGFSIIGGAIADPWKPTALVIGLSILTAGLGGLISTSHLNFVEEKRPVSNDDSEIGDYNTIYGEVKTPAKMGHGNTIVGPTDARGNTIIGGGVSIGYAAGEADPTSTFIGAFAGSGLRRKPPSDGSSGSNPPA